MGVQFKPKNGVDVHVAKGQATVTHENNAVENQEEIVKKIAVSGVPVAYIGMRAGTTINTGKYENVKFEASLIMPVPLNGTDPKVASESLDEAFSFVEAWVDEKMNALVSKHTDS